jgi:hypothetical protein
MTDFKMVLMALLRTVVAIGLCCAAQITRADTQVQSYQQASVKPALVRYDTELFNLLINQKNIIDGKNRFDGEFSTSFDKLLKPASAVKTKKDLSFLRKRLLSGPEGRPKFLTAFGKNYFYYDACQAHACDQTNLSLLYDAESKVMHAILVVNGVSQLLGKPSPEEVKLLGQLKSEH